jgi:hypothetical protein
MKVNQKKSFRQQEQQSLAGEGVGGPNSDDWTENHVYSVVYTYMEFRDIKHHKERHRKKEEYSTNMKEYSPVHRVHTEWQ